MSSKCDFRPRFCSSKVFDVIKRFYDDYVWDNRLSFRQALEYFEDISEGVIRPRLGSGRSVDQAWRSCKGYFYEYAVCRALDEILSSDPLLSQKIDIVHGLKLEDNLNLRGQVVIKNWSDILPDVDFVIVNKSCNKAMAVMSCKTSLRERITETAFWSKELRPKGIEIIFVTTDKDEEITSSDINRYAVMHVFDCTVITDSNRYKQIIEEWKRKYGHREDFYTLVSRVISFNDIERILHQYARKC